MKKSKVKEPTGRTTEPISVIEQEKPGRAPRGWAETQNSIAEQTGISLLLVEGRQPPALAISNNNSICEALQSSPKYVKLCDPYCGAAHARATSANSIVHYRCHAGLQCFAMPAPLDDTRRLAVIGGRAFVSAADYRELAERVRSGDLNDAGGEELFRSVIFADEAHLDHAALKVARIARDFEEQPNDSLDEQNPETVTVAAASAGERRGETIHVGLDRRAPYANSIRRFAEQIDASEPNETYESILAQSAELVAAERGSLFLFDEATDELTIKAARGIPEPVAAVSRIRAGEGIAGKVLRQGRPIVGEIDQFGTPAAAARRYKTKSFMSYPIAIGRRKIGVLNLADKVGGGTYDADDLSVIELVGPQIALALERAAWQQRAGQFQLQSITDPLTGLHNRRYQEARLAEELSRSKRYNYPLSFMMIDIDDFKHYNDRNGHQAGDRALEITAQCLKAALRKVDVASRYGGEEFSILLPQTTLEEAGVIADRIRRKVMETPFPNGKSQPLGAVTVSIGLSSLSPGVNSAEAIVRAADRALYHAKNHGKNRAYAYQAAAGRPNLNAANPAS
jgi:diguanylate cyclase (GGDEF)-like protein